MRSPDEGGAGSGLHKANTKRRARNCAPYLCSGSWLEGALSALIRNIKYCGCFVSTFSDEYWAGIIQR